VLRSGLPIGSIANCQVVRLATHDGEDGQFGIGVQPLRIVRVPLRSTGIGETNSARPGSPKLRDKLDGLEPVTRKQLVKLIRVGAVTVLDVRPSDEFDLGHLPAAVNIPLRALKARLAEINPDREIVAYFCGEYCVLSFESVALLQARGFKARRLEEGLPEWRAAGLPINKKLFDPKN
jgi:rhodanese-related sulfurtransferase